MDPCPGPLSLSEGEIWTQRKVTWRPPGGSRRSAGGRWAPGAFGAGPGPPSEAFRSVSRPQTAVLLRRPRETHRQHWLRLASGWTDGCVDKGGLHARKALHDLTATFQRLIKCSGLRELRGRCQVLPHGRRLGSAGWAPSARGSGLSSGRRLAPGWRPPPAAARG